MFGVGFSEIILIAVVALIAVGPERLPEIGRHVGKALRAWNRLKDEFTVKMHHIADTGAADRVQPVSDIPAPAVPRPSEAPPIATDTAKNSSGENP